MSIDELVALEDWVEPLLAKLGPAKRRELARVIARDLRRSQAKRIAAQLNPDGSRYVPRKPQLRDRAGSIRRAMFGKIRQAKHLKASGSADEASVGFVGRVARIASVHQFGLTDRVEAGGALHAYPARRLLGIAAIDWANIQRVMSALLKL